MEESTKLELIKLALANPLSDESPDPKAMEEGIKNSFTLLLSLFEQASTAQVSK